MSRRAASHLLILIVGFALGLGAVAVANRQQPPVTQSAAGQAKVVRQLKAQLKILKKVNKSIGGFEEGAPPTNVVALLTQIEVNTRKPGPVVARAGSGR
jgi:hypothetical protein